VELELGTEQMQELVKVLADVVKKVGDDEVFAYCQFHLNKPQSLQAAVQAVGNLKGEAQVSQEKGNGFASCRDRYFDPGSG